MEGKERELGCHYLSLSLSLPTCLSFFYLFLPVTYASIVVSLTARLYLGRSYYGFIVLLFLLSFGVTSFFCLSSSRISADLFFFCLLPQHLPLRVSAAESLFLQCCPVFLVPFYLSYIRPSCAEPHSLLDRGWLPRLAPISSSCLTFFFFLNYILPHTSLHWTGTVVSYMSCVHAVVRLLGPAVRLLFLVFTPPASPAYGP